MQVGPLSVDPWLPVEEGGGGVVVPAWENNSVDKEIFPPSSDPGRMRVAEKYE